MALFKTLVVPSFRVPRIALTSAKPETARYTNTNDVGRFDFKNVETGDYDLEITSPGFTKFVLHNLRINDSIELTTELEVNMEELMGVLVIADTPLESVNPQVSSEIQPRPTIPDTSEPAQPGKSGKSKAKKNKNKLPK